MADAVLSKYVPSAGLSDKVKRPTHGPRFRGSDRSLILCLRLILPADRARTVTEDGDGGCTGRRALRVDFSIAPRSPVAQTASHLTIWRRDCTVSALPSPRSNRRTRRIGDVHAGRHGRGCDQGGSTWGQHVSQRSACRTRRTRLDGQSCVPRL